MKMMTGKYQTLSQFMLNPFNKSAFGSLEKDRTYNLKYIEFNRERKIRLAAVLEMESSYYYLIKIPSESSDGTVEYDVVIRFFPKDDAVMKEDNLRNYYIQFFSNSPGFTYKFAYVYNKEGYLIKDLYDKINSQFLTTPPKKTNKDQQLSYDKSIYFACKFLSDDKFKWMNKNTAMAFYGTKSAKRFFELVNSDKSLEYSRVLSKAEADLQKELTKHPVSTDDKKIRNHSIAKLQRTIFQAKTAGIGKITGKAKVKPKGKLPKISSKLSTKK